MVVLITLGFQMLQLVCQFHVSRLLISEVAFLVKQLSPKLIVLVLNDPHLVFLLVKSQLDCIFFPSESVHDLFVDCSRRFVLQCLLKLVVLPVCTLVA